MPASFTHPQNGQSVSCTGFKSRALWLLTVLAVSVTTLHAHPGHVHKPLVPAEKPAHWFIEPEHAFTWLMLGAACWLLYRVLRQRTLRTEPATESIHHRP